MSHSDKLICSQCRASNHTGNNYCTTCGASLEPTEGKRTITHAVIAAAPTNRSRVVPSEHPSSRRSRRLAAFGRCLIALALYLGVVSLVFTLMGFIGWREE